MVVRIVGIGRRAYGDDGAGPAVIARLRADDDSNGFELHEVAEPSALIPLLEGADRVIIVDATLGARPAGRVIVVRPDEVETAPIAVVSTHGMSVGQAMALAQVLAPETVCPEIYFVAIAAQAPDGVCFGLSSEVSAAIDEAAQMARTLAIQPAEIRGASTHA